MYQTVAARGHFATLDQPIDSCALSARCGSIADCEIVAILRRFGFTP